MRGEEQCKLESIQGAEHARRRACKVQSVHDAEYARCGVCVAQRVQCAEHVRHISRKVQSMQGVEFDTARAHWMSVFCVDSTCELRFRL